MVTSFAIRCHVVSVDKIIQKMHLRIYGSPEQTYMYEKFYLNPATYLVPSTNCLGPTINILEKFSYVHSEIP